MSRPDPTTGLPVTGEAVALELRVARLPSRTLALLLDLCVQVPLFVGVLVVAAIAGSAVDPALAAALALVAVVGVIVGYPVLVETLSHGRSLGKVALGLRVVRDDGGPTRFRHALVRGLFLVIELWLTSGVVGLIASLLSVQGKRLGDQFAGTLVVNERVTRAAAMPAPLPLPHGLQAWAAGLDLSRLPDPAAAQAQQLLGRWAGLAAPARDRLAVSLADEISTHVAPPPPPGVPAPAYLAAVLAERSRRAIARGHGSAPSSRTAPPTHPEPPRPVEPTSPLRSRPTAPANDGPFHLPF